VTAHVTETTATLPGADLVGQEATWVLPTRNDVVTVRARYLGQASSQRAVHSPQHRGRSYALGGTRCGACRWFEPRIFREVDGQRRYLIHYAGLSSVPGEGARLRHEFARTGYEVVEALTTRRRDPDRDPSRCPVCDGTGLVSRPPGVAGDQESWSSNAVGPYQCQSCGGAGVLHSEQAFLTLPAARVLAQAAGFDDELNDAYVNRAVS
jgi:hypothetical protein